MIMGLALFFGSCSENNQLSTNHIKLPSGSSVFNMSIMFTEMEGALSFPVWFEDSIVRINNIETITRQFFSDSVNQNLQKSIKYTFDKEGHVSSILLSNYYDLQEIGSTLIVYKSASNKQGYSKVARRINEGEQNEEYVVHERSEDDPDALIFMEKENLSHLYFIPDSANWGIMSLELEYDISEQDWVVFGTPREVHKRFRLKNTVELEDVIEVLYNEKAQVYQLLFENYPFNTKRDLLFRNQLCVGFVDSTFTNDEFLKGISTDFKLDNKGLPTQILYHKFGLTDTTEFIKQERFEYTYYDKN